ncbi:MAG: hypothetical protein H0U14_03685 [Thermoleophilaceae bacterium]|nr:hypothetical protein [Thermoleophilaceae bacterium]
MGVARVARGAVLLIAAGVAVARVARRRGGGLGHAELMPGRPPEPAAEPAAVVGPTLVEEGAAVEGFGGVELPVEPLPEAELPVEPSPEVEPPVEPPPVEELPVKPPPMEELVAEPSARVDLPIEPSPEVELPVERPPIEEPPVERPPIEEPPIEPPPIEDSPVEEPSVEEPSVEESTVELPSVEEPTVEPPPADEATDDDLVTQPPGAQQPRPSVTDIVDDLLAPYRDRDARIEDATVVDDPSAGDRDPRTGT